jgi:photosystem II stability/assembly factor-like uncharacterized protein
VFGTVRNRLVSDRIVGAGLALALVATGLIAGPEPAPAEPREWAIEVDGPWGGDVRGLLEPVPGRPWILWTRDAGPFGWSAEAGRWVPLREGLPSREGHVPVTAVAGSAADPGVLYAGMADGWIFRSRDGGRTWEPRGILPAQGETIQQLLVHTARPEVLLALTRSRVFRSADGGASWTRLLDARDMWPQLPGLPEISVQEVLTHPLQPGLALLVTRDQGLLLTRNFGLDIEWLHPDLPSPVDAAAADPTNASIVYLVAGGDLYQSLDGGRSWHFVGRGGRWNVGRARSLLVDPVSPQRLVVWSSDEDELLVSRNGGYDWERLPVELPGVLRTVALDPQGLERGLVVGTSRGLWRSTDGGRSWQEWSAGLADVSCLDLVLDPRPVGGIWCASDRGLFRRREGERGWRRIPDPFPEERIFHLVAVSRGTPSVWALAPRAAARLSVEGVAEIAWSWDVPEATDLLATPEGLLLCGVQGDSVWMGRPEEEGVRWRLLPDVRCPAGAPRLVADPGDPGRLFLLCGGLYQSRDGGERWDPVALPPGVGEVRDLARPVSSETRILLATDRGLFAGDPDSGQWELLSPGAFPLRRIACDVLVEGRWFLASADGLLLTVDGGEHWTEVDLGGRYLSTLRWDPSKERLLLGFLHEGVGIAQAARTLGLRFPTEPIGIVPNPFQGPVRASFRLREATPDVTLEVYSVFGDRIRRVRLAGPFARDQEVVWEWDGLSDEGGAVAAGVYVFRTTIGGRPYAGKGLLLR